MSDTSADNRCYPSDSEATATGGDGSGNGFYVRPGGVYLDSEGDAWWGNRDGTLSLLRPVDSDDRYAHWTYQQVESLGLVIREVAP